MENKSLRFYAIMALWVVLFVLLFVSNRRVDLKTDINKSHFCLRQRGGYRQPEPLCGHHPCLFCGR